LAGGQPPRPSLPDQLRVVAPTVTPHLFPDLLNRARCWWAHQARTWDPLIKSQRLKRYLTLYLSPVYIPIASSTEGRFREASQGGTNRGEGPEMRHTNLLPGAGEPGNPGRRPVRPPRVWSRKPGTRAVSGLRPAGHYEPPARSLLTIRGESGRKRGPGLMRRKLRCKAAVERREARRPASLAGDLRRSADRPSREAGQRVRRSAPAPVGALPPSLTCKGEKKRETPGRKK
jgi:hypothetical protein